MGKKTAGGVKLTEHFKGSRFAGFKRMVGGQTFYLGAAYGVLTLNDRPKAEAAAAAIENEWRRVKPAGGWSDASIEQAKRFAIAYALGLDPMTAPATPADATALKPSPTAAVQTGGQAATPAAVKAIPKGGIDAHFGQAEYVDTMTFGEGVKAFLAERLTDLQTGDIDADHYEALGGRLRVLQQAKDSDGLLCPPDIRIADYGRDAIHRIVAFWKKRPVSRNTGKKIGPQQVGHMIGQARQLFRWFYKTEKWNGFRAWEEAFKFKPDALRTPSEKREARKGRPKYTPEQLATLYAAATPRTRLYMLLALNCGMGAKEQATLQTADVYLDGEAPYIERERNKTGVPGRWTLWNETAQLLRFAAMGQHGYTEAQQQLMKTASDTEAVGLDQQEVQLLRKLIVSVKPKPFANESGLAIMTTDGMPLVHRSVKANGVPGCKTSAVAAAWGRLMGKSGIKGVVPNYGFYSLRRTASQMIRNIGGLETSKVFLCHAAMDESGRMSVAERHYNERTAVDFDKVATALTELRTALNGMFEAAREADDAPKVKRKHNYPKVRKGRILVKA